MACFYSWQSTGIVVETLVGQQGVDLMSYRRQRHSENLHYRHTGSIPDLTPNLLEWPISHSIRRAHR